MEAGTPESPGGLVQDKLLGRPWLSGAQKPAWLAHSLGLLLVLEPQLEIPILEDQADREQRWPRQDQVAEILPKSFFRCPFPEPGFWVRGNPGLHFLLLLPQEAGQEMNELKDRSLRLSLPTGPGLSSSGGPRVGLPVTFCPLLGKNKPYFGLEPSQFSACVGPEKFLYTLESFFPPL